MSLGENSLVAAYQGKEQLKSRPSGTSVVTFIGGSDGGIRDSTRKRLTSDGGIPDSTRKRLTSDGGIRYPTRKRLTGYGGYDIQRETVCQVSMFKGLVWVGYSGRRTVFQRQWG